LKFTNPAKETWDLQKNKSFLWKQKNSSWGEKPKGGAGKKMSQPQPKKDVAKKNMKNQKHTRL